MKYTRPPFNQKEPVYVRRSFTSNGRTYLPGQRFDWKYYAVSVRRAAQMYNMGKITHESMYNEDEVASQPIDTTPYQPKIVHKSGPWYDVVREGEVLNEKSLHKKDAEQFLKDLNA